MDLHLDAENACAFRTRSFPTSLQLLYRPAIAFKVSLSTSVRSISLANGNGRRGHSILSQHSPSCFVLNIEFGCGTQKYLS